MQFAETYAEIKARHGFSPREFARSLALDGLSLIQGQSALKIPRVQFLYIHHTFADELASLERLLDWLALHFTFVSHTEGLDRVLSGNIDQPYLSISSDDGFKNNISAARILAERGISACFYINPALTNEKDESVIEAHCKSRLSIPPVQFLNWTEVVQLQNMGHEIGSHTMDHMNIGKESPEKVRADILETKDILTRHCGSVEHFAWPYGLWSDFNEEARKAVFEAGFRSCASAERGAHIPHGTTTSAEDLCIRRDHIILDWKLSHIKYFIIKSAKEAVAQNDLYPYPR